MLNHFYNQLFWKWSVNGELNRTFTFFITLVIHSVSLWIIYSWHLAIYTIFVISINNGLLGD